MNEAEKIYYTETEKSLKSKDKQIVKSKIRELKSKGSPKLLPLVLELLDSDPEEDLRQDILVMLGDLRDQKCADVITGFISDHPESKELPALVATCWQSRVDYSGHLNTFAGSFVNGDYQTAIECFTVIEEAIWKASEKAIGDCRSYLLGRLNDVNEEKKPLFNELIEVLASGRTRNSEDFPDLYPED